MYYVNLSIMRDFKIIMWRNLKRIQLSLDTITKNVISCGWILHI